MSGSWGQHTWGPGNAFQYYYPLQVPLRSVGPGRTPDRAAFGVSVDPHVVAELAVASVRLNNKPFGGNVRLVKADRSASQLRSSWRAFRRLAAGDVLDVRFTASLLDPSGRLTTIKHAVVSLIELGSDMAQRRTGNESLTRLNSVWE